MIESVIDLANHMRYQEYFPMLADAIFNASEGFKGRTYDNQTTIHPFGLALLLLACILILTLKRRYAFIPFLVMACFVSGAQRIVIGGIDFDFTRILILTGAFRVLIRGEWVGFKANKLDVLILIWGVTKLFCTIMLWMDSSKLVWGTGQFLDVIGGFFVFRFFICSWDDLILLSKTFAYCAVPVAFFFLIEYMTAKNIFSVFGGVPETTVIREGKLRCQGAFAHPIVAGSFWAAIVPSFVGLLFTKRSAFLGIVGLLSALLIIFTCTSSTPVFGLLMGMIGLLYWFARKSVVPTLVLIAVLIPCLHLVMKAPVWHLVSRISAVGGSTAYHRYNLIDQFVNRFAEWALFGTKTTVHWGHFLFDVANHYIVQGTSGGLLTFILFLAVLTTSFVSISRALDAAKNDKTIEFAIWCLGLCLLTHCACFIGISYFGQITQLLNIHLAFISSVLTFSNDFRADNNQWTLASDFDNETDCSEIMSSE